MKQKNTLGFLWYFLVMVVTAMIVLILTTPTKAGPFCYRGGSTVTYSAPTYYQHHSYYRPGYSYYQEPYYYKEYVPYAVEVLVNKDRYYSLSDLYRDQLYLEAFDMMKQMRARLNSLGEKDGGVGYSDNPPPSKPAVNLKPQPDTSVPPPPATVPQAAPRQGGFSLKTPPRAAKVLNDNCVSCHGGGNGHIDLSKPDVISPIERWAAFGMAASRDMPRAPENLRAKGKEKELEDWKAKNTLSDEILKILYDEWVAPANAAQKK